jgi:hemoglobin
MKPDIENKEDIKLLVDTFYEDVKKDELLGFIFNDLNIRKNVFIL